MWFPAHLSIPRRCYIPYRHPNFRRRPLRPFPIFSLLHPRGNRSPWTGSRYDTDAVVERIEQHQAEVVIPSKSNRKEERKIDENLYENRNKVERFFLKIKQNRAVAPRYDKKAACFLAVIYLASIMCWLK